MCFDQLKRSQDIKNIVFMLLHYSYENDNKVNVLIRRLLGSSELHHVNFQYYKDCPDDVMRQLNIELSLLCPLTAFMITEDGHVEKME